MQYQYIHIFTDLNDYNDTLVAISSNETKSCEYFFCTVKNPAIRDVEGSIHYLLMPNGDIKKIKDIDTVKKNYDVIYSNGLEQYKAYLDTLNTSYEDIVSTLKDKKKELLKNNDILAFIQTSMQITSIYAILEEEAEEMKESKEAMDQMVDAIKTIRDKEEEDDISNELEIVNSLLKKYFSQEELDALEIKECSYNGKVIPKEEMLDELSSHVLPEFLIKQVDINETKSDTYYIRTNLGTIYREPDTMNIQLINEGE